MAGTHLIVWHITSHRVLLLIIGVRLHDLAYGIYKIKCFLQSEMGLENMKMLNKLSTNGELTLKRGVLL